MCRLFGMGSVEGLVQGAEQEGAPVSEPRKVQMPKEDLQAKAQPAPCCGLAAGGKEWG